MFEKLKSLLADDGIYMACLLVLVGITSFGLGRLSVAVPEASTAAALGSTLVSENGLKKSIATTSSAVATEVAKEVVNMDKETLPYVASKSGTKYHKITCPGAKQIKIENKIFFATPVAAKAAGYTPAANCPGLE